MWRQLIMLMLNRNIQLSVNETDRNFKFVI